MSNSKRQNSKAIGNQYERDFSYKLSEWLTGEKDADVCWRDVGSGSRFTARGKKGLKTAMSGDIICTNSTYQPFFDVFSVDTKTYKEWNSFFINPSNMKSNAILHEWIKTVSDANKANKLPMMPCKIRDRKTAEFIIFEGDTHLEFINATYHYVDYNEMYLSIKIVLQEEFFRLNNWEFFVSKNEDTLNLPF